MAIEMNVRNAIRDAVNRTSRKPFYWGGLKGYQQLQVIADVLYQMKAVLAENFFFQRLVMQVDRALAQNQDLAAQLEQAHTWLRKVAACLHYPQSSYSEAEWQSLNSQQVADAMEDLIEQLRRESQKKGILAKFQHALEKRWKAYGSELLPCYDIPGLPQHNLHLESFFNQLRGHQRRISGRRSTKELRDFGQFQALLISDSPNDLLEQIRCVPLEEYKKCRQRLAESEAPRRFINQLHRQPSMTIHRLLIRYVEHQRELTPIVSPTSSACNT